MAERDVPSVRPRHIGFSRRALVPALLVATSAQAQLQDSDPTIANLPRPGYEPRTILVGTTVLTPDLSVLMRYDDNVFATPADRQSAVIADLRLQVGLRRTAPGLDIRGGTYVAGRRYTRFARENATTFGAQASAAKTIGNRATTNVRASFDRLFERRSDPEAIVDPARRPSLVDRTEAGFDARLRGSRFDLAAAATITKFDYRRRAEDDRDLSSYQASLRGGWRLTGGSSLYLQPFLNYRNARLEADRGGFDRDVTTMGVLAGVSLELAERVTADVGVGAFRANPADPRLASFTGVAFSGRASWRPRVRTAVLLQGFRGDVATIRAGATGRVDTRVALSVDQEAYHNLIMRAAVGLRTVEYRGAIDRDQRYASASAGVRYLVNRHVAVTLDADWTRRGADVVNERFRRWTTTAGLVFTY